MIEKLVRPQRCHIYKKPMDPGVLIVRTTAGAEFTFDAGTHSYEVWISDKKQWRKVEIKLHTDKGSWIVKTIDFPVSIERRFSTPNAYPGAKL